MMKKAKKLLAATLAMASLFGTTIAFAEEPVQEAATASVSVQQEQCECGACKVVEEKPAQKACWACYMTDVFFFIGFLSIAIHGAQVVARGLTWVIDKALVKH